MKEILLLIIACCLLFGSEKTRHGIGVVLKVIGIGIVILIGLSFFGSYKGSDEPTEVTQEVVDEYTTISVEELQDAFSQGYDYAKDKYDGMSVSIEGRLDTPHEELGLSVMPYLTNIETDGEKYWIPILVDSDELTKAIESAEKGSVVTMKGTISVATQDDNGIEASEDSEGENDFAIILIPDSIE